MNYGRSVVLRELDALGIELGPENSAGWAACKCPLHEDSKPSFTIKVAAGAWRCRSGCGSSGDLAELIQRITDEPVADARNRMMMGLTDDPDALNNAFGGADELDKLDEPESLWYDTHRIPKYILQRGFTTATCKRWKVGLDRELPAVVIPVYVGGELTGLIRRRITPGEPKYMYSWGLKKDEVLFGLDMVTERWNKVVVVEGSLDCMWLEQAGYPAVAILGSSMSDVQADQLRRRFREVILAFDNDKAGREATISARRLLRGLELRVAELPEGVKDVQECDIPLLKSIFTRSSHGWYAALASHPRRHVFYVASRMLEDNQEESPHENPATTPRDQPGSTPSDGAGDPLGEPGASAIAPEQEPAYTGL